MLKNLILKKFTESVDRIIDRMSGIRLNNMMGWIQSS